MSYHEAQLWNLLPNDMKEYKDIDIVKASVRNWNELMCKCRMGVQLTSFPRINLTVIVCIIFICITLSSIT